MEAPVFIREHARNIRHFVAALFAEYRGWNGAADSSANEFICAEITAAIARHEADAWRPMSEKPSAWDAVVIGMLHKSGGKPIHTTVPGFYGDGRWYVLGGKIQTTPHLAYEAPPVEWQLMAWRYQPRYTPPVLEG